MSEGLSYTKTNLRSQKGGNLQLDFGERRVEVFFQGLVTFEDRNGKRRKHRVSDRAQVSVFLEGGIHSIKIAGNFHVKLLQVFLSAFRVNFFL